MPVSLKKAMPTRTRRQNRSLEFVSIMLGWDMRHTFGKEFDLDISCFLLNKNNTISNEKDFIFYNNPTSGCGSVSYLGDNTIGGAAANGDEIIHIDLPKLKPEIERVVIAVTIHDSEKHGQKFGLVQSAYVKIINRANNRQLAFFDLSEAFAQESAVIVCELYRGGAEWKFKTIDGQHAESLSAIAKDYGVCVQ